MEFLSNNTIQIDPPKRPKKLTGTKFAAVLGLNRWNTPFKEWCAITRTYEEPFEDNKYTIAGKVIEPKVAEFLKKQYFLDDLTAPEDIWGKDYFKKTYGNFFKDKIFGGMWDFKGDDYVVEVKTSSRPQDWEDEPPIYYVLQACLYAYLLEVDTVYLTVSFLQSKDYELPKKFKPTLDNTKIYEYSMSSDFPNFVKDYVEPAVEWWNEYVIKGISPQWEDADSDIIKELKTTYATPTSMELNAILSARKQIVETIAKIREENGLDALDSQLKVLNEKIKKYMDGEMEDDKDKVEMDYEGYVFTLTKSVRKTVDSDALKKDGLYLKYLKENESKVFKVKQLKEEN